jgi:hypothetical protein
MEILIILLVVIVIIGALLGGKSFGGTIRKGCGFIILSIIVVLGLIILWPSEPQSDTDRRELDSSNNASTYYIVKEDCQTYTKPDIKSNVSDSLVKGEVLMIRNPSKYKYFYQFTDENGTVLYVRKQNLTEQK